MILLPPPLFSSRDCLATSLPRFLLRKHALCRFELVAASPVDALAGRTKQGRVPEAPQLAAPFGIQGAPIVAIEKKNFLSFSLFRSPSSPRNSQSNLAARSLRRVPALGEERGTKRTLHERASVPKN